jgi:hypothetical protein
MTLGRARLISLMNQARGAYLVRTTSSAVIPSQPLRPRSPRSGVTMVRSICLPFESASSVLPCC